MARFPLLIALLANVLGIAGAAGQDYPTRPVRFVVPFGPAAGADIAARLFADRLATRWGKPVFVENRPGGDGLVAITAFTGASDDHTLLWAPAGTFAVHPYEHDKLPYDAERDLLPIASVSTIVLAMSTSVSLKLTTISDLVSFARAHPGKLNAAAANGNSDFLLFGFLKGAGLDVLKVPYRDILQAPNASAHLAHPIFPPWPKPAIPRWSWTVRSACSDRAACRLSYVNAWPTSFGPSSKPTRLSPPGSNRRVRSSPSAAPTHSLPRSRGFAASSQQRPRFSVSSGRNERDVASRILGGGQRHPR